jgi:hypothetical protein
VRGVSEANSIEYPAVLTGAGSSISSDSKLLRGGAGSGREEDGSSTPAGGARRSVVASGSAGTVTPVWQKARTGTNNSKAKNVIENLMTASRDIHGVAWFEPDVLLRIFALDYVLVIEGQPR